MSPPAARLAIANARLAVLGDAPKPDEPPEHTEQREHYLEMRRVALEEISQTTHAPLPYKDDD